MGWINLESIFKIFLQIELTSGWNNFITPRALLNKTPRKKKLQKTNTPRNKFQKTPYLKQRPSILKRNFKIKIGDMPRIWETNSEILEWQSRKKTMDDEIYEARIWKPNFVNITSVSSQKKIPAEIYCRETKARSSQRQLWVSTEVMRQMVEINNGWIR